MNKPTDLADGFTALMCAATHGDIATLTALLNAGADVNAATTDGRTALMHTVEGGDAEYLEAFLEAYVEELGGMALTSAAQNGHTEGMGEVQANSETLDLCQAHELLLPEPDESTESCIATFAQLEEHGVIYQCLGDEVSVQLQPVDVQDPNAQCANESMDDVLSLECIGSDSSYSS